MPQDGPPIHPNRTQAAPVNWVIAGLLAIIAAGLWYRPLDGKLAPAAFAQSQGLAGARGTYAFPGSLGQNRDGLFMLDVDQGTIWCYEFESVDGRRKLRLVAARTWIYDRYLQDFNCAPPDFRTVRELVEKQREQAGQGGLPASDMDQPQEREPAKTEGSPQ